METVCVIIAVLIFSSLPIVFALLEKWRRGK